VAGGAAAGRAVHPGRHQDPSSTSARPRSGPSSGRAATGSPSSPASGGPTWASSWRALCPPPCSRLLRWRCWRDWSAACCHGRCSRSILFRNTAPMEKHYSVIRGAVG
jgi:hypothetical protein